MPHPVHDLAGPQTVHVVVVGDAVRPVGCACQLPAVLPVEGPAGAVVVADRVAGGPGVGDRIGCGIVGLALIGNLLPVVGRQLLYKSHFVGKR